jgi:hypothetical protein
MVEEKKKNTWKCIILYLVYIVLDKLCRHFIHNRFSL